MNQDVKQIKAVILFLSPKRQYVTIEKVFNGEKHIDNYINKMEKFGWKEIGSYY